MLQQSVSTAAYCRQGEQSKQPSYLYLGLVYILVLEVVKVVNTAYLKKFKVKVGINFRYDICFMFLSKFFIFNISFHFTHGLNVVAYRSMCILFFVF